MYIQLTTHHINNRALKPSEFKMNAILDFARFLSSGCFVGDLGVILGDFAVVVCVWSVLLGFYDGGGFSPGGFVRGGFVRGGFVRGVLSGRFCPGRFCPGGFCPWGFCPGGFCPGNFVGGVLSGGVLSGGFCPGGFCPGGFCPGGFVRVFFSRGVLSTGGGVCPSGGFVQQGIVRGVLSGGFCPGGFCPRILPLADLLYPSIGKTFLCSKKPYDL